MRWSLAISRRLRRMGGACFSLPGERSSPLGFGLSLDENHFPYLMLHSRAFCDI